MLHVAHILSFDPLVLDVTFYHYRFVGSIGGDTHTPPIPKVSPSLDFTLSPNEILPFGPRLFLTPLGHSLSVHLLLCVHSLIRSFRSHSAAGCDKELFQECARPNHYPLAGNVSWQL